VLRTSLAPATLDAAATVESYKQLADAERAFRSLKTVDIELRPVHHRRADRVRAHVFLCILAYYVEWHAPSSQAHPVRRSRQARKPTLAPPSSPKPTRSKTADRKARTKRTDDGLAVHSFRSLLGDLVTVTRNTMAMIGSSDATFVI